MSDFIGFSLDGMHSSELNIVRVSDSGRFNENLLPTTTDYNTAVPGRDGSYYFGRDYKNKTLSISIAYNEMTEVQKRKIQLILNKREPMKLIFDEEPYKTYYVLSTNNSKLSFVCFAKDQLITENQSLYGQDRVSEIGRIYKGEGTLSFTLFDPYAHSIDNQKYVESYNAIEIADWNDAAKLKYKYEVDQWNTPSTGTPYFNVYNPSDLSTKPRIYLHFTAGALINDITLAINNKLMTLSKLQLTNTDNGIVIDTETELIIGLNGTTETTTLYNQYISNGYFLSIPSTYSVTTGLAETMNLTIYSSSAFSSNPSIEYDYLYS